MKVSTLIAELTELHAEFGDMAVYMDVPSSLGLLNIGEVGVDVDDTGIILWCVQGEDDD
jgi:hypothetical protein